MKKTRSKVIGLGLFAAVLSLISCATNPVTGRPEFMLLSEAEEAEMGRQTDAAVVQQFGLWADQSLADYVSGIGAMMGRYSHRPHLPYSYKVMDSEVVNAFADDPVLTWVDQREQKGTGHAAMICREALGDFEGNLVVIAGDMPLVRSETLTLLVERHEKEHSAVTLATVVALAHSTVMDSERPKPRSERLTSFPIWFFQPSSNTTWRSASTTGWETVGASV